MQLRWILGFTCVIFAFVSVLRSQVADPGESRARHDMLAPGLGDEAAPSNSTPPSNRSAPPGGVLQGFCFLGVSVLGFGSSMVPIRSLNVGDGMFFQLVFCSTMSLEGLLVFVIRGCPQVWALSLLAGFLYGMGNLAAAPIIKTIGLGLGSLIWSLFSLLFAWATARFGWFGIDPQDVPNPTLNYIGTAITAISAVILFFLKTEETPVKREEEEDNEPKPLLSRNGSASIQHVAEDPILDPQSSLYDKLSPPTKRMLGSVLAVFAGICYGCAYTPIIYIKDNSLKNNTHFPGASQFDLDYLFPHMLGVTALTTAAFIGYCIVLKNRPYLPSDCVVPAFCGATLHFVAYFTFFEACYHLGTIITYPIGCTGPALISLLWSVFYFKEIKGIRNFLILATIIVTVICGVTLITLSKIAI